MSRGGRHCTLSTKLTSGWLNSDTWIWSVMSQVPTIGGLGLLRQHEASDPDLLHVGLDRTHVLSGQIEIQRDALRHFGRGAVRAR